MMICRRYGHRLQSITIMIGLFLSEKLQFSWEIIYACKIIEFIIIILINARNPLDFLNTSFLKLPFYLWIQAVNKISFSLLLAIYLCIGIATGWGTMQFLLVGTVMLKQASPENNPGHCAVLIRTVQLDSDACNQFGLDPKMLS